MSDQTRDRYYSGSDADDTELGNKALEGTGTGAAIGGTLGAIVAGKSLAAQMREHSLPGIKEYFSNFELPAPAEFVNYEIDLNGIDGIPQIKIEYLGEQDVEGNTQISIADEIQRRLDDPAAKIILERIAPLAGTIEFTPDQANLSYAAISLLDSTAQKLQQNPRLQIIIKVGKNEKEPDTIIGERAQVISNYLISKRQIASDRITILTETDSTDGTQLQFKVTEKVQ